MKRTGWRRLNFTSCFVAIAVSCVAASNRSSLDFIRVSGDGSRFVFDKAGKPFTPWGFNYDHDRRGRLLETYWRDEWPTVEDDFAEMKQLGANVVRIHLQISRFMKSPRRLNRASLRQLERLVAQAERTGIYLDLTGLGCYDRKDVPDWFNNLDETNRWAVQARFWDAVAKTCSKSPAIFCYDLMNEPVVTEDKTNRDWTPGEFGGFCFVQRSRWISMAAARKKLPTRGSAKWWARFASATRDT